MFMTSMQVFLFHANLPALSGLSLLLLSRAVISRVQATGKPKNQPSMTSPFWECWGQTATKRSLEKTLV